MYRRKSIQRRVETVPLGLEVELFLAYGVGCHGGEETDEDPLQHLLRTVVVRVGEE